MTDDTRQKLLKRLEKLKELEDGWFGPHYIAINRDLIELVKTVIESVDERYLDNWGIYPMSDGGLSFESLDSDTTGYVFDIEIFLDDKKEIRLEVLEMSDWREKEFGSEYNDFRFHTGTFSNPVLRMFLTQAVERQIFTE